MSLQTLAQNLQQAGRGKDKVLVHMTPDELQGLQKLAYNHGKSLTINPKTGLPEAGILNSILPIIAGAVLTPVLGPATPFVIGAGAALLSGNLEQGLQAGLSAYSGGSIGKGLKNAAANTATSSGYTEFVKGAVGPAEVGLPTVVKNTTATSLGNVIPKVKQNIKTLVEGGKKVITDPEIRKSFSPFYLLL